MAKIFIDVFPPKNKPGEEDDLSGGNLPEEILDDGADLEIGAGAPPLPVGQDLEVRPRMQYNLRRFEAEDSEEESGKGSFLKGLLWKLSVVAVVILLTMYFIDSKFAKAQVKIWPQVSEFQQNLNVGIDTSVSEINLEKNLIPGYVITAESVVTRESPATGQKLQQGKAQGTVKIFNNYTNPQRLVKGTRLQAPLEKFQPALEGDETPWFRTVEDVLIDPKSSVVVEVVADGAGEKYNIEPSVFSIPGLAGTVQYTFVYGQSFEKFSGGSDDAVPEATKEDIENTTKSMTAFSEEQIKSQLIAKIREQGLEIADESAIEFKIGDPEVLAKAGDNVAMIKSQAPAEASAVAYKKSDLEKIGKDFILSAMPQGTLVDEKSFSFTLSAVEDSENGSAIELVCRAVTYEGMSDEDLKKGLSEKNGEEAKMFLASQSGVRQIEIKLTPPWRLNVPRSLDKIEIETILE